MNSTHNPLTESERSSLLDALRRNATDGAALLMSQETSFVGVLEKGHNTKSNVIDAVRSVPNHY